MTCAKEATNSLFLQRDSPEQRRDGFTNTHLKDTKRGQHHTRQRGRFKNEKAFDRLLLSSTQRQSSFHSLLLMVSKNSMLATF